MNTNLRPLELGFDEMKYNTALAEAYTKKHGGVFRSILPSTIESSMNTIEHTDKINNKIIETVVCGADYGEKLINKSELLGICLKLKNLAKRIEEEIGLFSQLEYLIRNVPMDDTKNVDIKLMIQNLQYLALECDFKDVETCVVVMENRTPLFLLGSIGQVLLTHDTAVIQAEPEAAAVCTLFTELCHSVGLDRVYLEVNNNAHEKNERSGNQMIAAKNVFSDEGVCVITEKCDIESATDALVVSSTWYPWRLKYVLVQESMFEQFRSILSFKAKLKNEQYNLDPAEEAKLRTKSTELILLNKKAFIINSVGYIDECKTEPCQPTYISAYRTNKELINLVKIDKYTPNFTSLWCNDVSEINEIIHNLKPLVTWVNDYNKFEGPIIASQSIYSPIELDQSSNFLASDMYNKIKRRREDWLKLTVEERRQKLINAFDGVHETRKDNFSFLLKHQPNSFIEFSNNSVCFGRLEPVGFVKLKGFRCSYQNVVNSMIHGNAVLVERKPDDDTETDDLDGTYNYLQLKGFPIVIEDEEDIDDNGMDQVYVNNTLYGTKVVYQSFGTIFAN